jgi:hypothetical protein
MNTLYFQTVETTGSLTNRPGKRTYYIVAVGSNNQEEQPLWFETK